MEKPQGMFWVALVWKNLGLMCMQVLFPKSVACPEVLFSLSFLLRLPRRKTGPGSSHLCSSAGEGGCGGDKVSPLSGVPAWEMLTKQVLAGQGGSQEVPRALDRAVTGA